MYNINKKKKSVYGCDYCEEWIPLKKLLQVDSEYNVYVCLKERCLEEYRREILSRHKRELEELEKFEKKKQKGIPFIC